MKINDIEDKIYNIYKQSSDKNLYKKQSKRSKIVNYIVPLSLMCIEGIIFLVLTFLHKYPLLQLVLPIVITISLIKYSMSYQTILKSTYKINNNIKKNIRFELFKKQLSDSGIKDREIEYALEKYKIEEKAAEKSNKTKSIFIFYLSAIYIPVIFVYFNDEIKKISVVSLATIALVIIPMYSFLIIEFINHKSNIKRIIHEWLSYIDLENKYKNLTTAST